MLKLSLHTTTAVKQLFGGVLFEEIHRKISQLEFFLIKFQAICSFITKENPGQVFSCKSCEIFKNIYFEELQ